MNTRSRPGTTAGFSLIELLIVVVIAGILAAVAYPSYMGQVRSANRTDAREALTLVANGMERFFATNRTYTTDLSGFGLTTEGGVSYSKSGHYRITAAAGNTGDIASSYLLTAVPVEGDTQAHDDECPMMSLSSAGVYFPSPEDSRCW